MQLTKHLEQNMAALNEALRDRAKGIPCWWQW